MQQADSYRTFAGFSEGLYKEKGSKFLSFACPVADEDAVKEQLQAYKKQYHDARHHCYAYVLGTDSSQMRAYDDGEPNHSAGDPILGQLRAHQLTQALLVVVRYFGGTKLGVGGLIHAYRSAAAEAILNNTVIDQFVKNIFRLRYPYHKTNDVLRLIDEYQMEIIEQQFAAECTAVCSIRAGIAPLFIERAKKIEGLFITT
jgi:uncharacterized YigZ family protein